MTSERGEFLRRWHAGLTGSDAAAPAWTALGARRAGLTADQFTRRMDAARGGASSRGAFAGARVQLVRCADPFTRLRPGERGTVEHVDALGTLHVRWDSGSSLGLVPGVDAWTLIETPMGGE